MNTVFKKSLLVPACLFSIWVSGQPPGLSKTPKPITSISPQNISPVPNKKITVQEAKSGVLFKWTAVLSKPGEAIVYKLKIWQLKQGENITDLMKASEPVITKDVYNSTQVDVLNFYSGPCKLPYLCEYGWTIEAVIKNTGKEKNKTYGISEASIFSIEEKKKETSGNIPYNKDIESLVNRIKEGSNSIELKDLMKTRVNTQSFSESFPLAGEMCAQLFYPAQGTYIKHNVKSIVFQFSLPAEATKQKMELVLFKKAEFSGKDSSRKEFRQIHRAFVTGNSYRLSLKVPLEPGEYNWGIEEAGKRRCGTANFSIISTPGVNCDSIRIDSIKCIGTAANPDLRRVFTTIVNCSPQAFDFAAFNNYAFWTITSANQLISSTTGTVSNISTLPASIPAYTSIAVSFDYTPVSSFTDIWIYDWPSYLSSGGLRLGAADVAGDSLIACRCTGCDQVKWQCTPASWLAGVAIYLPASNSVGLIEQFCIADQATGTLFNIKQISAEITGFNFVPNDTNCLQCQNSNKSFGNFYEFQAPVTIAGSGVITPSTGFNAIPYTSPPPIAAHSPSYSRELIWQSLTTAGSTFSGHMLTNISLPPLLRNACCSSDCDIWIRYTITKSDCTVCSVTYKYHFTIPHL